MAFNVPNLDGELVDKSGAKFTAKDLLAGKKAVGIYFSAHWCPPCRGFTPVLAEFYNEVRATHPDFEIVFVSSDQNEQSWQEYLNSMPWKSLPFGDARKGSLGTEHGVSGIPCLVIVNPSTGAVITKNGRGDVQSKGAAAYNDWTK